MIASKSSVFICAPTLTRASLALRFYKSKQKSCGLYRRIFIKAQLRTPEESSSSESSSPSERIENTYRQLLRRLEYEPDPESVEEETTLVGEKVTRSNSLLALLFEFVRGGFNDDIDRALSKPSRLILASSLCILFGFFSATSASTIIGSVADWDPLAAAVLLIWTESFTKFYYTQSRRSRLLQLINAFKVGLIYGMTVDAFKLTT